MDDRVGLLLRRVEVWLWRFQAAAEGAGVGRPMDARQSFASGPDPYRVLMMGSGPAAGWGVASHDLALPGAFARALASSTGRGVVVDVLPDPVAGVRRLGRFLAHTVIDRYDVVVFSGAVADTFRLSSPASFETQLRALLVRSNPGGGRVVVWLGAQPIRSIRPYENRRRQIAQDHADVLNHVAEDVCAETGNVYVPLPAPPGTRSDRYRSPGDYMFWARQIVDALTGRLASGSERGPVATPAQARVAALERLKLNQHRKDPRLDSLVAAAKRAVGADMAMLTVLDDRYEWPLVSTAAVLDRIPIEQSACIHTMQTIDGLVIADATKDDRFAHSAFVTGPAGLRYYAGYPLEAPDGTRIGALCVLARAARDGSTNTVDIGALRELAMLTQRELWSYIEQ